jgi:aquaporin Z
LNKYNVEFIGSFFVSLAFILNLQNDWSGPAVAAVLVAFSFAGHQFSGAHFNPAVSFAVWMRGNLSNFELPRYLISQILAAVLAALIGTFLLKASGNVDISQQHFEPFSALISEFLGSFAVVFVFLCVNLTQKNRVNSFLGLAVGAIFLGLHFSLKKVSGGAFNPSVGIGFMVGNWVGPRDFWIYFVGCFLGGAVASTIFTVVYGRD